MELMLYRDEEEEEVEGEKALLVACESQLR